MTAFDGLAISQTCQLILISLFLFYNEWLQETWKWQVIQYLLASVHNYIWLFLTLPKRMLEVSIIGNTGFPILDYLPHMQDDQRLLFNYITTKCWAISPLQ